MNKFWSWFQFNILGVVPGKKRTAVRVGESNSTTGLVMVAANPTDPMAALMMGASAPVKHTVHHPVNVVPESHPVIQHVTIVDDTPTNSLDAVAAIVDLAQTVSNLVEDSQDNNQPQQLDQPQQFSTPDPIFTPEPSQQFSAQQTYEPTPVTIDSSTAFDSSSSGFSSGGDF